MKNLQHTAAITEGQAMGKVFDACRANSARQAVTLPCGYSATFTAHADGVHHQVALRNSDGLVEALADVDAFDC